MRFLHQWYTRTFVTPKQIAMAKAKIAEILPDLLNLQLKLKSVRSALVIDSSEKLDLLVEFFNLTSPWHDRGLYDITNLLRGVPCPTLRVLEKLDVHFEQAGRNKYGWNRTMRGERVTADKVWLGGICGLFTLTIPDWQEGKDSPKNYWDGTGWENYCRGMNSYDMICKTAIGFMQSHLDPMIDLIEAISKERSLSKAA